MQQPRRHRIHVENMVHKILIEQGNESESRDILNTTLDYMLDEFPVPDITDELMDLAVYIMADKVEHFFKDNYADLPDELYPLAVMRVLGSKLTNKRIIDPARIPNFDKFQKRYQKFIMGKFTGDNRVELGVVDVLADAELTKSYNSRKQYKIKLESAKTARQQGLTAKKWRTEYLASFDKVSSSSSSSSV